MIRKIDCDKCKGVGTILCPACKGDEVDQNGQTCSFCSGVGIVICDKCDGNGTIEVEINDEWVKIGW